MAIYKITTEVELSEDVLRWQVKDLESLILDRGREAMRRTFLEILGDYEKAFLKTHCEWVRKERWPKKVSTLFGDVRFERYRVWDNHLKKSRYPLDESLGISKWSRESSSYRDLVVDQTVKRSYRQSSQEVENQTGSCLPRMRAWQMIQKISQEQVAKTSDPLPWKRFLLPDPPRLKEEDPCPAMGIDLDDTYCRSWKTRRWEKDLAVRVAVLYRHKEKVGKKRWALKDKQVLASGPGEKLEHFLDRVTEKAITHYGLHQGTKVVVHGDGDPMIKNYALQYLPNALYRLDPWHVKKKIREATGLEKLPDSWESAIHGHPDILIAELVSLKKQLHYTDSHYKKIKDIIQYLQNNKEGLLPSGVSKEEKNKHPRLYRRGSGTIERNVDWTVNARFKQPRMSWSQKGLENLLHLRENYLNQNMKPVYPPIPGKKPQLLGIH